MGLVYVEAVVKHEGKAVPVKLLVDSGATYTVLKREVWEALGLKPLQEMEFILADGTVIRRRVSEALIELRGYGERHTPVVLGESEDENLLGIVTLEIFGLVLDPFRRELRPARMLMKKGGLPPLEQQHRRYDYHYDYDRQGPSRDLEGAGLRDGSACGGLRGAWRRGALRR